MGALVGLGVGVGLMLIWSAFFIPRTPPAERRTTARRASPGFVLLCVTCGLVVGLAVQIVSGTPPVAVVFGVMAAWLPVSVVSARARRRQRELAEVWPEAVDNLISAMFSKVRLLRSFA